MKIRELTHGEKSLDDFAAGFFGTSPGGGRRDSGPGVFPYSFADLVRMLNDATPYDWATFWTPG